MLLLNNIITEFKVAKEQSEHEKDKYTWKPDFKWLIKTFAVAYIAIIILFFMLNFLLKPYMRQRPMEITPWLDKNKTENVAEQK